MLQLLINPDTNERVQASVKGAEDLRERGWLDASPRNTAPTTKDPGRSGIIVQNLRVSDYNAASVDRIHKFLQSGDSEYAAGVLVYEQDHQNRPVIVTLAQSRLRELADAEPPVVAEDLDDEDDDAEPLERPAKQAGLEKWAAYARSVGVNPAEHDTKDDLIKAVDAAQRQG